MKATIKLSRVIIVAALCGVGCTSLAQRTQVQIGQHPHSFQKDIVITVSADYLLYLPEGYDATQDKWPLILFLHGAGERGNDLSKVEMHGPPKLIAKEAKAPICGGGNPEDAASIAHLPTWVFHGAKYTKVAPTQDPDGHQATGPKIPSSVMRAISSSE